MAKLRAAKAYRKIKRPYTRTSRLKSKAFIKGAPYSKVAQFDMGDRTKSYPYELQVISARSIQARENALEAARQTAVRYMELFAKTGWSMKLRAVPHHVIRENPLATGAGADRFQQGMSQSFGNPIGHAAQILEGKIIFSIYVEKEKIPFAVEAARKARAKLPMRCYVKILEAATGKEVSV
ncbi:MAG: 50S ribosomal protein L16 [Candidatus Nanoarchaeia archaeon]